VGLPAVDGVDGGDHAVHVAALFSMASRVGVSLEPTEDENLQLVRHGSTKAHRTIAVLHGRWHRQCCHPL
jgi:hypothetical protein